MSSPAFTEAFIIIHQNKDSEPFKILPYSTKEANYLGACISLCQAMLKEAHVKQGFNNLVVSVLPRVDPRLSVHWTGNTNPVEVFITKVLEKFPVVFVNDAMENPDDFAYHERDLGMEIGDKFDTHGQGITVNGGAVRCMCIAGTNAENAKVTNGSDSPELDDFHKFLFLFARAIMHELAHIFVTMLTHGEVLTPKYTFINERGEHETIPGESGDILETWIYSGLASVIYDPNKGKDQPGRMCTRNRAGLYEVSQKAINEFVRYQFNFPIHEGQPIGESQSLGSLTGKAKNKAPEVNAIRCLETVNLLKHHGWTVSHEWKETIKELLAKSPPANRFGTRFQTVMMQIPNEPGLRVEEAP